VQEDLNLCNDGISVITLILLHPLQSVPVQNWTFETETAIRIGRSTDNDVILYSAVVSRHHVEIRWDESAWKVVNIGANGTYIDGKRVEEMPVVDGMIIRLASSGPKIQIRLDADTFVAEGHGANQKRPATTSNRDRSKDTLIS
jgi:pSer/pThr/pTyr-binding forkhead associated (FHA) protein